MNICTGIYTKITSVANDLLDIFDLLCYMPSSPAFCTCVRVCARSTAYTTLNNRLSEQEPRSLPPAASQGANISPRKPGPIGFNRAPGTTMEKQRASEAAGGQAHAGGRVPSDGVFFYSPSSQALGPGDRYDIIARASARECNRKYLIIHCRLQALASKSFGFFVTPLFFYYKIPPFKVLSCNP